MILAITGKAGAGKDTIGDYLCKKYNYTKINLADPIKRIVKDVFVLSDETVYDRIKREEPLEQWNGWTVRKLLQFIGTELFRNNIDPETWVKSLWYRIKDTDKNWVICDTRFPNELKFFKDNAKENFKSIKVVRNGCTGDVGIKGHASEAYDLDTDITIENNGTLEDLYTTMDNYFNYEKYTNHIS